MKKLRVVFSVLMSVALVFTFTSCGNKNTDTEKKGAGVVNIYMWGEYMSDTVASGFEKETGIKVNFSYMNSSDEAAAKIKAGGGSQYDIVMPCDADMGSLIEGDFLEPIDSAKLSNYKNLYPMYQEKDESKIRDYAIPYLSNWVYVIYNKKTSPVEITKYEDLLDPKLNDEIASVLGPRNLFPMALASLGYDPNSKVDSEIKEASEWLTKYMKNVTYLNSDDPESALISGKASVGFVFEGQASKTFKAEGVGQDFVVAKLKDPIQLGIDELVIPKGAKNKDNAIKFLNYLLDANVMATNLKNDAMSPQTCPNEATVKIFEEESWTPYTENPAINIPKEMSDNHFLQLDVGSAMKVYDKYYTEVVAKNE